MPKYRGAEQGDVDGPLEYSLPLEWWQQRREEASPRDKRRAPFPEIGVNDLQRNSDCKQTGQIAGIGKLPAWWPSKAHLCSGPAACVAEKRINGAWTTVTSCVTQSWCCLFCRNLTPERNPLKTEVICCVNDLDAAPPEWRAGDAVTDGSMRLESLLDLDSTSRTNS